MDTRDWRIQQGIQAAIDTWPHLTDLLSFENDDTTWLRNKMKALSHCMTSHVGYSQTCDYALLARLLLEEQELDEGRSSGKTGKYASRFHPSISTGESVVAESSSNTNESSNSNGSRPLTVGEIEVNWSDGACLSETLLARYNVDKKNPLAAIQASIERQCKVEKVSECSFYLHVALLYSTHLLVVSQQQRHDESSIVPVSANEIVCKALSKCTPRFILRVGHACDLQMIQSCFQNTPLHDVSVVSTVQEAISIPKRACLLMDDSLSDMQALQASANQSTTSIDTTCYS